MKSHLWDHSMIRLIAVGRFFKYVVPAIMGVSMFIACGNVDEKTAAKKITLSDDYARAKAQEIRGLVSAEVDSTLTLSVWASDTLLGDPVGLDMTESGVAIVSSTNRRKSTEFDIRQHRYWEEASLSFQSVDDRRNFLRNTLTAETSGQFHKPYDHNGDSIQDWHDLTVESEEVIIVEDQSGDGLADASRVFADGFQTEVTDIAGGVQQYGDDIFLAVAPDLWRLQDLDKDGFADKRTSLSHGFQVHIGYGGHNMSGVKVGPDGKIYWGIGDIGFNGVDQDGKRWFYPNQGVIVRCNPDGSDFEVFAHGLRNTHEFVFDAYGNIISVDNDGDHPGEHERLVYIVNGSDTGWRINWQFGKYRDPDNNEYKVWMDEGLYKPRFEGQAAYILPCIDHYINGPTGMLYNPGTVLGDEWADRFFVVEFNGNPARSGIHSFSLQPHGASFKLGDTKKILSGVLATGLDAGPDGAIYFTDWIDGWERKDYGRIWKLESKKKGLEAIQTETKQILGKAFDSLANEEVGAYLAHRDMRVRQKAQFELVDRGAEGASVLADAAASGGSQFARIHGIWGLGQLLRSDNQYGATLTQFLNDDDPEIRAQVCKMLGDARYGDVGSDIVNLLSDDHPRVQYFATEALGRIGYRPAVKPLLDLLQKNNDEDAYLRHGATLALSRIGEKQPIYDLVDHKVPAMRLAAVLVLRHWSDPFLGKFLKDRDTYIATEAARAINDDWSVEEALPELGAALVSGMHKSEAFIRRAIGANSRTGSEESIEHLIAFASDRKNEKLMRIEAISALGVWANPSVFDRVTGRYRGEVQRDEQLLQAKAGPAVISLLKDVDPDIRKAALVALDKMEAKEGVAAIVGIAEGDKAADVRSQALLALSGLAAENLPEILSKALQDKDKEVRIAALELVQQMDVSPDKIVEMTRSVLLDGSVEEQQASILALKDLPSENIISPIREMIERLVQGQVDPAIQLELIEVAESLDNAQIDQQIREFRSQYAEEGLLADYIECVEGGSPSLGRQILASNSDSECLKCHQIRGYGGVAGPALDAVGARLASRKLLQSLVDPSAEVAPGFGVVTVILKDESAVSGIAIEEDDTTLVIRDANEEKISVDKSQIEERINAASSMPPMTSVLDKHQLRDLVAFLKTLKGEEL